MPNSCSAAPFAPGAKVLLVTRDGARLDVTAAVGSLIAKLRPAGPGAQPPCPAEQAALCVHVGHCRNVQCAYAMAEPHEAIAAANTRAPAPALTEREAQIVARLREGDSNKEIARALGIKEDTVKKHLHSAYGKLGVRRRAALVVAAWPSARS